MLNSKLIKNQSHTKLELDDSISSSLFKLKLITP